MNKKKLSMFVFLSPWFDILVNVFVSITNTMKLSHGEPV